MMKIQKGQVKYNNRDDYYVNYGITDDNKQYYFITRDVERLSNGNYVASTELVEAIDDMFKASHVGIISEEGVEVIPFIHRRVKPVNDDIVLAEVASPVSQSVIDAINARSDASAATTLVSTTTAVKDKISAKMSSEGRFIFNDLFSEATLYDINGNKLVDGEFSFIGLDNGKIYLSKNTADSEVVEYSILPPEVQSDVTPQNDSDSIDVTSVEVDQAVVEGALNNEVVQESAVDSVENNNVDAFSVDNIPPEVNIDAGVAEAADAIGETVGVGETGVDSMTNEEVVPPVVSENPVEAEADDSNEVEKVEDTQVANTLENDAIVSENDNSYTKVESEVDTKPVEESQTAITEEVAPIVDAEVETAQDNDVELNLPDFEEENDIKVNNQIENDPFKNSVFKADSIDRNDYMDISDVDDSLSDPDIADGTKIITGLINQNKELKATVAERDAELEKQSTLVMNLTEKDKMQRQKIEVLTDGRKRDRAVIQKLQSELAELEKKTRYLERINAAQSDEIEMLKPQIQGKEALVKLYAEAEALLGEDDSYGYNNLDSYYRKSA